MAKIILSIILTFTFIYSITHNFSSGDAYFQKLVNFNNAITKKDWQEARYLERDLDKKLVRPLKESGYPEYLENQIQSILSQKKQTADTNLNIAQIYFKLGDKPNAKKYLEIARSFDPIRQDIKQVLLSL